MSGYDIAYSFYGANKDAVECQAPEVLLIGPAETGKTLAMLWKLHRVALKYENVSIVIARKTLTSAYSTVLRTWEEKIVGDTPGITKYGGEKAQWWDYFTGSRVMVAGMDKSSRVLSAEHDIIYNNQIEEYTLDDWETLTTRTTGRAGHIPHPQCLGDANPSWPQHWMYQRKGIERFYSWHKDNPTLFDPRTGAITSQGERTVAQLKRLTGLRYKRLWLGQAAPAEGVVYEGFSEAVHIVDRFEIPEEWRRIRCVDFGYTNPFICQWWAIDGDGRMYLYREIYQTQTLVEDAAREIVRLSEGEHIEATVCDHDAEDRATLERHGVPTVAAKKDVSPGIQAVESRIRKAGDNKPRLFLLRDSLIQADAVLAEAHKPTCTEQEFPAYAWEETKDGKPNKEQPLKMYDHAMDAMRYGVMYVDGIKPVIAPAENPFYA